MLRVGGSVLDGSRGAGVIEGRLVEGRLPWGSQCSGPLAFGTAPLLAESHGPVPLRG